MAVHLDKMMAFSSSVSFFSAAFSSAASSFATTVGIFSHFFLELGGIPRWECLLRVPVLRHQLKAGRMPQAPRRMAVARRLDRNIWRPKRAQHGREKAAFAILLVHKVWAT
jgi:hypothetical protein